MNWIFPSVIATICGSFILVMVYLYLYQREQKSYLAIWACSWSLYLIRYGFMGLIVSGYDSKVFLIGNQLSVLASGLLLVWGTYIFLEQNMSRGYLYFGGLNAVWIILGIEYNFSFLLVTLPTFIFLGLIYMWVGRVFINKSKEERHHKLVGYAFMLWGVHKLNYPFLRPITWFAPWGYIIGAVLLFSVAVGMLSAYFENMSKKLVESEEKYRSMMEAIEDLVVITSSDYIIEYANPAVVQKIGQDIRGEVSESPSYYLSRKCFEKNPLKPLSMENVWKGLLWL